MSESSLECMQGAGYLLFPYLKGHFGAGKTALWPPSCSEADGGLSAYHLGFTALYGGVSFQRWPCSPWSHWRRFLLCPPSSSLPVASCGVINVCSTTSCLHTLTHLAVKTWGQCPSAVRTGLNDIGWRRWARPTRAQVCGVWMFGNQSSLGPSWSDTSR